MTTTRISSLKPVALPRHHPVTTAEDRSGRVVDAFEVAATQNSGWLARPFDLRMPSGNSVDAMFTSVMGNACLNAPRAVIPLRRAQEFLLSVDAVNELVRREGRLVDPANSSEIEAVEPSLWQWLRGTVPEIVTFDGKDFRFATAEDLKRGVTRYAGAVSIP